MANINTHLPFPQDSTEHSSDFSIVSPHIPSPDDFVPIRAFMCGEGGLDLKPLEEKIYALIYQFSIDGQGCFFGGQEYLAMRFDTSQAEISKKLRSLVERGLIIEDTEFKKGTNKTYKRYKASLEEAEKAKTAFCNYWESKLNQSHVQNTCDNNDNDSSHVQNTCEDNNENSSHVQNTCDQLNVNFLGDFQENQDSNKDSSHVQNTCDHMCKTHTDINIYKYINNNINHGLTMSNTSRSSSSDGKISNEAQELLDYMRETTLNKSGNKYAFKAFCNLVDEVDNDLSIIRQAWNRRIALADRTNQPANMYPNLKHWLDGINATDARSIIAEIRVDTENKKQKREAYLNSQAEQQKTQPNKQLETACEKMGQAFQKALSLVRSGKITDANLYEPYRAAREEYESLCTNTAC